MEKLPNKNNASTIQALRLAKIEQMANSLNTNLANSIEQLEKTQASLGNTLACLKAVSDEVSTLYEIADRLVE